VPTVALSMFTWQKPKRMIEMIHNEKQGLFIKIIVCVVLKYTSTIWVLKFYDETYTQRLGLNKFCYKKGIYTTKRTTKKSEKNMSSCLPYGVTGIRRILRNKPCTYTTQVIYQN